MHTGKRAPHRLLFWFHVDLNTSSEVDEWVDYMAECFSPRVLVQMIQWAEAEVEGPDQMLKWDSYHLRQLKWTADMCRRALYAQESHPAVA